MVNKILNISPDIVLVVLCPEEQEMLLYNIFSS